MTVGRSFRFPDDKRDARRRVKRYAWMSIVLLSLAGTLLALTLGQSEAMKTAWVSDVLTAVPSAALLVALRFELREPSKRYPFGYLRSVSIAFLVTASVLTVIGLYLLYDAVMKLVRGERPPIGTMELFGRQFWAGWAMVTTLFISLCVGMLLGRLKQKVAEELHAKAVEAESRMNRAEWMSEGAAIVGIVLVGFGHWWADAAAAAFISLEIVRDGWDNMRQVVADLMDESPSRLGTHDLEDVPRKVKEAAERLPWVARAAVRLREQGHVLTGDVFVVPQDGADHLPAQVEAAARSLSDVDWRLHGLVVMPVTRLAEEWPPRL